MNYEIDKTLWHICKICLINIKDVAEAYGGNGIYYTEAFKKHLSKDHNIELYEYFTNHCQMEPPLCLCGICNKKSFVRIQGSKFSWRSWVCGRTPGTMEWSKRAKTERKGKNNPMFGKDSWNKGLTKDTSDIMKKISDDRKGIKHSDEAKRKMSEAQRKRKFEPHAGHKHTEECKEKIRQNTLRLIKEGVFAQLKSKPHVRFGEILNELNLEYIEEKIFEFFTFDYYIPILDLYVEVDGDYFHSNPRIYPNGPKSKTQKINYYRDKKKNKFCQERNINLIRFWECDILNNPNLIKEILCSLKES